MSGIDLCLLAVAAAWRRWWRWVVVIYHRVLVNVQLVLQ